VIYVLVGPSGAGKGTIAAAVVARVPGLRLSRSWTTRPPRPGEAPDAYVFVDEAAFRHRAAEGGFLEWAEVFGHLYGTPWPPEGAAAGDVLLEIDVQGARQVRHRHPEAVVVLVDVPSAEAQRGRLLARGDDPGLLGERLAAAPEERRRGRDLADHVVVNEDLGRAVEEVAGIVGTPPSATPPAGEGTPA